MGPIVLMLASFVFILDAAFLFGKADPKGTGVANAVIGILMAIMGLHIGFTADAQAFPMILSSLAVTFSIFYLVLAWCLLRDYELKALGWYCLGAGLWVALATFFFFGTDKIFGVFGIAWTVLFFAAFANLARDSKLGGELTRWLLAICAPITLMIPAFLLITGNWPAI